jgi:hypothetical protein
VLLLKEEKLKKGDKVAGAASVLGEEKNDGEARVGVVGISTSDEEEEELQGL